MAGPVGGILFTLPHFFLAQSCEVKVIAHVYPQGNGGSDKCVHLPRITRAGRPDGGPGPHVLGES